MEGTNVINSSNRDKSFTVSSNVSLFTQWPCTCSTPSENPSKSKTNTMTGKNCGKITGFKIAAGCLQWPAVSAPLPAIL
jgi:hypothetical protein